MTKQETIQVLQSIEDRAVKFPNMTACDWVAIAAAKRHLENILEVKEVDLTEEIYFYIENSIIGTNPIYTKGAVSNLIEKTAKHFFELGLKAQKGE